MRLIFFPMLFLIAVSLTANQSARAQDDISGPRGVMPLAKSEDYFVHVINSATASSVPSHIFPVKSKFTIFHTSISTGRMQRLYESGEFSQRSPPMGVNRIYHTSNRLLGVGASEKHLFLASWQAKATVMLSGPKTPEPKFGKGKFFLTAFNLTDGRNLGFFEIDEQPLPKHLILFDSLKVSDGKIKIGDHLYEFNGEKFSKIN